MRINNKNGAMELVLPNLTIDLMVLNYRVQKVSAAKRHKLNEIMALLVDEFFWIRDTGESNRSIQDVKDDYQKLLIALNESERVYNLSIYKDAAKGH